MSRLYATVSLVAVCALAVAGCGQSEEEKIRETINEFVSATNERDFERVCALFDSTTTSRLRQQGNQSCEQLLESSAPEEAPEVNAEIREIEVNGDTATAQTTLNVEGQSASNQPLRLRKQDGEWKLDFTPAGGSGTQTEGQTGTAPEGQTGTGSE